MAKNVKILPIDDSNVVDLARILSSDAALANKLGRKIEKNPINPQNLLADLKKWQSKNNADSFAILLNNKPIGLISLSHQSGTHARVGYWLVSSEWNKGYTTQAFKQIVNIAKDRGFTELSASINPSDKASSAIWDKHGALFTYGGKMLQVKLII